MDQPDATHDVYIFCDASERAYGSVAYLRTEDSYGNINLAFLMARSRVAPRRQHSMSRLELCTAVTGAQLAKLIKTELTLLLSEGLHSGLIQQRCSAGCSPTLVGLRSLWGP